MTRSLQHLTEMNLTSLKNIYKIYKTKDAVFKKEAFLRYKQFKKLKI